MSNHFNKWVIVIEQFWSWDKVSSSFFSVKLHILIQDLMPIIILLTWSKQQLKFKKHNDFGPTSEKEISLQNLSLSLVLKQMMTNNCRIGAKFASGL